MQDLTYPIRSPDRSFIYLDARNNSHVLQFADKCLAIISLLEKCLVVKNNTGNVI